MPKGGLRPNASCHPDRPHSALGLCTSCYEKQRTRDKEAAKRWKLAHPDRIATYERRRTAKRYGITPKEYDRMCETQKGRCLLCREAPKSNRRLRLDLDHDHKTGIIRGLLCDKCNRGLGAFGDNSRLMRLAADYVDLRRSKSVSKSKRPTMKPSFMVEENIALP